MPKVLTATPSQIASDDYFDGSRLPVYIYSEVVYYLRYLKKHPEGGLAFLNLTQHKLCPENFFGKKGKGLRTRCNRCITKLLKKELPDSKQAAPIVSKIHRDLYPQDFQKMDSDSSSSSSSSSSTESPPPRQRNAPQRQKDKPKKEKVTSIDSVTQSISKVAAGEDLRLPPGMGISDLQNLIKACNKIHTLDDKDLTGNAPGVECVVVRDSVSSDGQFKADRLVVTIRLTDMMDVMETSFELSSCGKFIIMTSPTCGR